MWRAKSTKRQKKDLTAKLKATRSRSQRLQNKLDAVSEKITSLEAQLGRMELDLLSLRVSQLEANDPENWDQSRIHAICEKYAEGNIMLNCREYSVVAYEGFRTLVAGAGLSLSQVKYAFDTVYTIIFSKPPPSDKYKISRTVVRSAITALGLVGCRHFPS